MTDFLKVGLFQLYDTENEAEAALMMCQEAAVDLQALAWANGRPVKVEAHAVLRTQAHYYKGMMKKDTTAYIKANSLVFDRLCVWANTTRPTVARGWGEMGGIWSIVYSGQTLTNAVGTMFHEAFGHNDYLNHAATTDNVTVDNLGDDYRMGGGNSRWNYSAFEKVMLGLLPEPEQVFESVAVRLVPTHTNPLAMHNDEHRFVVCDDADGVTWGVSVPPTVGHPDGLQGIKHKNKFHVHKKIKAAYGHQFIREIPSREMVSSVKFSDEITITVLPQHDDLADVPGSSEIRPEHSGDWVNPAVFGQGLQVICRDSGLQVSWYTFDAFGNQDWFQCFTEGRDKFRILRGSRADDVGEGRVRMLSDSRLLFQFNTRLHGHNAFEMSPAVNTGFDERDGAYRYTEDLAGKGFTWRFFTMGGLNMAAGRWFTAGQWQAFVGYKVKDSNEYALRGIQPDGNVFAGFHPVDEHPLGDFVLRDEAGSLSFEGRPLVPVWR